MAEEPRAWIVGESGEVETFLPVQEMPTESEFEDLLVQKPEMLEPSLELVGRQTPIQSGRLDLLAVDGNGRLVVCELKRGKIVREAVGQVLAYAAALDSMKIVDLAEHIAECSGNNGIQGIDDFKQWYTAKFGGGGERSLTSSAATHGADRTGRRSCYQADSGVHFPQIGGFGFVCGEIPRVHAWPRSIACAAN